MSKLVNDKAARLAAAEAHGDLDPEELIEVARCNYDGDIDAAAEHLRALRGWYTVPAAEPAPAAPKRQRLTAAQRETLAFVRHLSADGQHDGWVKVGATGMAAACRQLIVKGWLEERETPLGDQAVTWWVRPLPE